MQKRGQGSLEYLLIIGGGILVAVVIIGAIVSLAGTGTGGTKATVAQQTCNTYIASGDCNAATMTIVSSTTTACDSYDTASPNQCCWIGTRPVGTRCGANLTNRYD